MIYLIPKGVSSTDPAKYRPIACLCTMYKIITAYIANKINKHTLEAKIMGDQQKGCMKGSLGCKEQFIVDKIVMKQANKYARNLHTDYAKAYDSVPLAS